MTGSATGPLAGASAPPQEGPEPLVAGENASVGQELLETFLALVPDAAVVVDGDGVVVTANESACELFGYAAGGLAGLPVEILVPERFRRAHEGHREAYGAHPRARAMGGGQDLTGRRADGSEVAVDISLAPIALADRPLVVAAVRDASERRAATAAQAQLAAIVESSRDAIVALSPAGVVMTWNAGAERLFGYTAEEVVGSPIGRLVPADAAEVFERLLAEVTDGVGATAQDTEWLTADGQRLPIALAVSPLLGPGRQQVGFSVSARDITDRKRAEAELRCQERWQAANAEIRLSVLSAEPLEQTLSLVCDRACELLDAPAAVVVLTADRPVVAGASARLRDTVGTELDEPDVHLSDAVPPGAGDGAPHPPRLSMEIHEAVGAHPSVNLLVVGGNTVGVLLVGAPAEAASTPSPAVIVESLADQAALALEIDRARRDGERLLLAEERDRIAQDLHDVVIQRLFASGMGLQAIVSLIGDERASSRVTAVVDQLDATIRDIRSAIFALGEGGDGRLRAAVLGLVRRAADQLGFRPGLRFDGPVDSTVPADVAAQLLAVLSEALSNVVRHARAKAVQVHLSAGDHVRLVVEDDGIGIDNPQRRSGLANMRQRAERLGGTLIIDTAPGAGTRLEWSVPLAR